jgi:8-oxo-dGTP diphosphatase
VAVIHRPAYDDWTFPKGKVEPGETLEQTALREVEEETGFRCRLEKALGQTSYVDHRGRDKMVWYWLMRPASGRFARCREVDKLRWLSPAEAMSTLSYTHDRDLLKGLLE